MITQNLNIQYLKPEKLAPYLGNARTHSTKQVNQIARSIKAFGFINPILIDQDNSIVAGHGRLMAAERLGLQSIPCIRVDHLDETERRAYILADNKLAENAGWDPDLLQVELSYLSSIEIDLDVELTGFSTPEIDILMSPATSENDDPPIPEKPKPNNQIVQSGDIWQLGPHRIICGDCRSSTVLENLMRQDRARLVFTDPPYNVPIGGHVQRRVDKAHPAFSMACGEMSSTEYAEFLKSSLEQLQRVSLNGSLHYVCMDWRHMAELLEAGNCIYDSMINLCIWNKTSGGLGAMYRSKHELVFVFKKGDLNHINNIELGRHGRNRTNVWDYAGINAFSKDRAEALAMHPTVKPVQMIADAIIDASKRNDIILDGFLGSGSTLIAAEQTGRIFRGVEIDPGYVEVTLERWANHTGDDPIHVESGKTYFELRAKQSSKLEHPEVQS